ncbi:type VI secretion system lipoprotein TssJ [Psychromonas sp.]|nr:type VI secretion system lipoprotein TssJ [Psychromonas sp.]
MFKTKLIKLLFVSAFIVLLSGCSTANTKVGSLLDLDTDFALTFIADSDVNPDDSNVPSPVIIRMYELKSTKLFENANFIDLYERDSEVLGKSMITKQSLKALQPNNTNTSEFVLSKEAQYIGLYVEFLQYENAKYKVIIPIAQTNVVSSSATVELSGNRIVILE